jgi:hypothetical protein
VREVPAPDKSQTHLLRPKGPVLLKVVTVIGEGASQRNKRSKEQDCDSVAHASDREWFRIVGLGLGVIRLCGSYEVASPRRNVGGMSPTVIGTVTSPTEFRIPGPSAFLKPPNLSVSMCDHSQDVEVHQCSQQTYNNPL